MSIRNITIDPIQIIWLIIAVVLAVTQLVNPWLVLLLATMDWKYQIELTRRS